MYGNKSIVLLQCTSIMIILKYNNKLVILYKDNIHVNYYYIINIDAKYEKTKHMELWKYLYPAPLKKS